MKPLTKIALVVLSFIPSAFQAQDTPSLGDVARQTRAAKASTLPADETNSIHSQIEQTYNFRPHLLLKQQFEEKSEILDRFWAKAKADPQRYIPALRKELADGTNPPFFFFDGSMLLLSLSDTSTDRQSVLATFPRCDLRDVQLREYFLQVHRMAALNENTSAAAFHVLDDPKFEVFIPQHSLTLGQNYVLVYLLLPTDTSFWLQAAIDRLQTEPDETAQKSLLLVLFYAQTDAADSAITAFASNLSKPSASRDTARELSSQKSAALSKETKTEANLRQERRDRLKSVSDEALIDLDQYTKSIMKKRR